MGSSVGTGYRPEAEVLQLVDKAAAEVRHLSVGSHRVGLHEARLLPVGALALSRAGPVLGLPGCRSLWEGAVRCLWAHGRGKG